MATILNGSSHLPGSEGVRANVEDEAINRELADISARIERLEKGISSLPRFPIDDVWCDRINMVGRISAVIMAAAGTAYLITVIFHFVVSSALVASFIQGLIVGALGVQQVIILH